MAQTTSRFPLRTWHIVLIAIIIGLQIAYLLNFLDFDDFETEAFGFPDSLPETSPTVSLPGSSLGGVGSGRFPRSSDLITIEGQDAVIDLDGIESNQLLLLTLDLTVNDRSNVIFDANLAPMGGSRDTVGGLLHRYQANGSDFRAFVVNGAGTTSLLRLTPMATGIEITQSHRRRVGLEDGRGISLGLWARTGKVGLFTDREIYHSFEDDISQNGNIGFLLYGSGKIRLKTVRITVLPPEEEESIETLLTFARDLSGISAEDWQVRILTLETAE